MPQHDMNNQSTPSSVVSEVAPAVVPSTERPMTDVAAGCNVVITRFGDLRGESLRVREMGLFEGRSLRVVHCSDPLICQVDQARVGLARRIACEIFVEPCAACPLRG